MFIYRHEEFTPAVAKKSTGSCFDEPIIAIDTRTMGDSLIVPRNGVPGGQVSKHHCRPERATRSTVGHAER